MVAGARLHPLVVALSIAVVSTISPAAASGQTSVLASSAGEAVDMEPPVLGAEAIVLQRQRPDFLFGRPGIAIGVRAGLGTPRAHSDVFDFITDELTLERSDFNSLVLAGDVDIWLSPRLDAVVGIGYSSASADSEYREWEDDETGLPIRQRTTLRQTPITAGLKYYLTRRGESIGRFAWIPARSALYAGAGGGFVRHSFRQAGEFIEFDEDGAWIIDGSVRSSGWSPIGHVFGGIDYSLGPRAVASAEARHSWSSSDMGRDFEGFEPIDLSGFQFMLGIRWRL